MWYDDFSDLIQTNTYTYNIGDDFLKWYKRNFGKDYVEGTLLERPDGMNDGVWNAGNELYQGYVATQADQARQAEEKKNLSTYVTGETERLKAGYASSLAGLDQSKGSSQQAASIMYDKLRKYLPTEQKAQGLNGLGIAESAAHKANTEYLNRMSDIEKSYNDSKTALDNDQRDAMSALDKYNLEESSEIEQRYAELFRQTAKDSSDDAANAMDKYTTALEKEQDTAFENAWKVIEAGEYTTEKDLANFLATIKGDVSPSQYNLLDGFGKQKISNIKGEKDADEIAKMIVDLEDEIANAKAEGTVDAWNNALKLLEMNKGSFENYDYYEQKIKNGKAQAEKNAHDAAVLAGTKYIEADGIYYLIYKDDPLNDADKAALENDTHAKEMKAQMVKENGGVIPNGTTVWLSTGKHATYYNGDWYHAIQKTTKPEIRIEQLPFTDRSGNDRIGKFIIRDLDVADKLSVGRALENNGFSGLNDENIHEGLIVPYGGDTSHYYAVYKDGKWYDAFLITDNEQ